MQEALSIVRGEVLETTLPDPEEEVFPGTPWGRIDDLFTPAFWCVQAWQHSLLGTYDGFRLGRSLKEEVTACLLGGFGMRAELGLAAFDRLRNEGIIEENPTARQLESLLSAPFVIFDRPRRYRFPKQKAQQLSTCLNKLADFQEPLDDLGLRTDLMMLPGIGPKTASWIVRNYRYSDSVAIIDVHILRAGRLAKFFDEDASPQSSYFDLERRFLDFADAIRTRASTLDNMMWDFMRKLGRTARARPPEQLRLPI